VLTARLVPLCGVALVTCCLLAGGCAPTVTVAPPTTVVREEPPPAVEAPFVLPTPAGPVSAPGEVEELVPGGAIDWSGKTVRARGTGVVDPGNTDEVQAWLTAERAATVVARRNLLEIVKRMRVDSDTRVEQLVAADDSTSRRVEAIVKDARQRDPARQDSAAGTVDVEMECDIYGAAGIENALAPAPSAPVVEADSGSLSPEAREFLRGYSGLFFDGSSAGLKPSLFPKVFGEGGNLLFDTRECLKRAGQAGSYAVQFVGTLDRVLSRPEFVRPPLVLKAREARGKLDADIVLGRGDAERVRGMKDAFGFLVGTGRILVKPSP